MGEKITWIMILSLGAVLFSIVAFNYGISLTGNVIVGGTCSIEGKEECNVNNMIICINSEWEDVGKIPGQCHYGESAEYEGEGDNGDEGEGDNGDVNYTMLLMIILVVLILTVIAFAIYLIIKKQNKRTNPRTSHRKVTRGRVRRPVRRPVVRKPVVRKTIKPSVNKAPGISPRLKTTRPVRKRGYVLRR